MIGATVINPELQTSAERLQYEGYRRGVDDWRQAALQSIGIGTSWE